MYELFIPMLLAAAGVTLASGQTASEASAGRLEIYLAQPVDRRSLFLGRAVASLIALLSIVVVVAVVQLALDALVDLEIDKGYLLSTIALCALLGAFHGSVGLAIAGLRTRPSMVLGLGIGLAVVSYAVAALFPLGSVLEP